MSRMKFLGRRFWFYVSATLIAGIVLVALLAIFAPFIRGWLEGLVAPFAAPQETQIAPPAQGGEPMAFNYTELFSGTGWENAQKTTAYEDPLTTAISFPPAYVLHDLLAADAALAGGGEAIAAYGSSDAVVAATERGNLFAFGPSESAVSMPLASAGPENLSSAAITYDVSRRAWAAVGLEGGGGLAITSFSFSPSDAGGVFVRIGEASLALEGAADIFHPLTLACVGGRCLVSAAGKFVSFTVASPSDAHIVALPILSAGLISSSVGGTGGRFIVGAVSGGGGLIPPATSGASYEGDLYELAPTDFSILASRPVFSSQYPGIIRTGYDPQTGDFLALYAAYVGQVAGFKAGSSGGLASQAQGDFSRFFGQRVLGGPSSGDIAVSPEVVPAGGGAWWFASDAGDEPRLLRAENSIVSDFTGFLPPGSGYPVAARIPTGDGSPTRPRGAYVFLWQGNSEKVLRIEDKGFDFSGGKVVWESSRLNSWDGNVTQGAITRHEDSSGGIGYFLSNDGGGTWFPAPPDGAPVVFPHTGGDFRFRVELSAPASGGAAPSAGFSSPWVDTLGATYYIVKK